MLADGSRDPVKASGLKRPPLVEINEAAVYRGSTRVVDAHMSDGVRTRLVGFDEVDVRSRNIS